METKKLNLDELQNIEGGAWWVPIAIIVFVFAMSTRTCEFQSYGDGAARGCAGNVF